MKFNDTGVSQALDDIKGKLEREAFDFHDKYINSANFFFNALPITGSIDTVSKLNEKYEVFIV